MSAEKQETNLQEQAQSGAPSVTFEPAQFRHAMRRHAAGVCVISVGDGDTLNGMAISAASSFSMEPPSVLICINRSASIAPQLHELALFSLAILGSHHALVATAFSRKPSGRPRFAYRPWQLNDGEPPWLLDAPANLSCQLERTLAYGSHIAVIGRVVAVRLGPDVASLVYRDGRYN